MPDIHEIVPRLFIGSHPRDMHSHIEAVVCVDSTMPKYEFGKLKGMTHLPILDGPNPGQQWLTDAVALVESYMRHGWATFVHCQAGISRSVFVVAGYLIQEWDLTPEQALVLIRDKRKVADPAPAFILALREFHKTVQAAKAA